MPETLRESLDAAAKAGLITDAQVGPLADFIDARALIVPASEENIEEDSEIPRFLRGYHDILITIGIVVALIGLGGLASIFAAAVAVIVLAEVFVRRQRLALPSFTLTIAFVICAGWIIVTSDNAVFPADTGIVDFSGYHMAALAAILCMALGVFYWRYRVPVALASMLAAAVVTLSALVLGVFLAQSLGDHIEVLLVVSGAVLIGIAMRFDFIDPRRVSIRSDVAFWLYLISVPAVLKGIFDSIQPDTSRGAALIVGIVIVMMLLGLLLDRRAFVTAGLVYLGIAFATLIRQNADILGVQEGDQSFMGILLTVGLIVLAVGFGWRFLRSLLVGILPGPWRARLPVVR